MKSRIFTVALLLITLVVLSVAHQPDRITEDDPRWNCRTMGNRICGEEMVR